METEKNIFKRTEINFDKLSDFGFVKSGDDWIYTKSFMDNSFYAIIKIDKNGDVSGNVYETDTDDIYIPLRIDNMNDGFVGLVRDEYKCILEDIKNSCGQIRSFIYPQANRLSQAISKKYKDKPTFPWDKFLGYGVFKNPKNGRWYAIIMNLDKQKIDKNLSGEIEVMNVKLRKDKITHLLKQEGFYPAYHMNKNNWITITLNETLSDDTILALVEESHTFTEQKNKKSK